MFYLVWLQFLHSSSIHKASCNVKYSKTINLSVFQIKAHFKAKSTTGSYKRNIIILSHYVNNSSKTALTSELKEL